MVAREKQIHEFPLLELRLGEVNFKITQEDITEKRHLSRIFKRSYIIYHITKIALAVFGENRTASQTSSHIQRKKKKKR